MLGFGETGGCVEGENMKIGTKSVLFGVHQFIWHPVTVLLAWIWLARFIKDVPFGWKLLFCIFIHDLGYWGKPNMDGPEGERHPEWAAKVASRICGPGWGAFCLLHSRHYARNKGVTPSLLCWADKLSIMLEPWWFYLPRAWLSGELFEYREMAANAGFIPMTATHRQWFKWVKGRLQSVGVNMRGDVVPYANPRRVF